MARQDGPLCQRANVSARQCGALRKDAIGAVVLGARLVVRIRGKRDQQPDGDGHDDDAADLENESRELAFQKLLRRSLRAATMPTHDYDGITLCWRT